MSLASGRIVLEDYAELQHSDWMFHFAWPFLTNQSALFQCYSKICLLITALWLDVPFCMTIFNQSECFISALCKDLFITSALGQVCKYGGLLTINCHKNYTVMLLSSSMENILKRDRGWRGCRRSTVDSSAPSILPPGFESQAYHLSFYKFTIVSCWKDKKKWKEAVIGPFFCRNRGW